MRRRIIPKRARRAARRARKESDLQAVRRMWKELAEINRRVPVVPVVVRMADVASLDEMAPYWHLRPTVEAMPA